MDHSKHQDHSHHNSSQEHHDHHAHMIADFGKRFWISLVLTLPIMVLAPMLQSFAGVEWRFTGDRYVQFGISSVLFFYGGWPFLKGMYDEIRKRQPGMMTLIALAISVAYFYSSAVVFGVDGKIFFWELASLIVIMLLGHWMEMKSVMRASNALEELAKLMPSEARRIKSDGSTEEVSLDELSEGDKILVRPGEKIPADGIVLEGQSHVNESMLTGESKPVSKSEDDEVIAGSINDNGSLKVSISHTSGDSYLNKVINMVKEAQETKSKAQNLASRAAAWLFYIAVSAGLITLFTWLGVGKNFEFALERMVTVMIISCPHALGLAVPLVVAISTSVAAQNGLLIRNRTAFENARKISLVMFDKTGTLTSGEFGVTRYKSLVSELTDQEMLGIAASMEQNSEHPIAAGILQMARDKDVKLHEPADFNNLTGEGIVAKVEGKSYRIVSPGSLKESGIELPDDAFEEDYETVVFLVHEDQLFGYLALADEIREASYRAVEVLKDRNIKVIMATGDNERVAKAVSEKLGLDDYHAEVLPENKQEIIKDLQNKGEFVAMTGDGVNDAPALAQADVGIAVGSGTDVAAETADIVLVNSDPRDITRLILFGSATYKKIIQNLWWAAGYNILAVPLAAGILAPFGIILSPAVGAVLMSLSTIIVAFNAQLLKRSADLSISS